VRGAFSERGVHAASMWMTRGPRKSTGRLLFVDRSGINAHKCRDPQQWRICHFIARFSVKASAAVWSMQVKALEQLDAFHDAAIHLDFLHPEIGD
jgi:hypothetical protein